MKKRMINRGTSVCLLAATLAFTAVQGIGASGITARAVEGTAAPAQTATGQTATAGTTNTTSDTVKVKSGLQTVTGTLLAESNMEQIVINTAAGKETYPLDIDTNFNKCMAYLPDRSVTLGIYLGLDGKKHVGQVIDTAAASQATVSNSQTMVVQGKLEQDSKGDLLYVSTDGGLMQIKLDAATDVSGTATLVVDKTVKITCGHGSDEYWHALTIVDR